MTITKKLAKDFIENRGSIDNLGWYDDVTIGISESGGFEKYCILEDNTDKSLYRFIYEQTNNNIKLYYKNIQLTPVEKTDTVVSVYTEIPVVANKKGG